MYTAAKAGRLKEAEEAYAEIMDFKDQVIGNYEGIAAIKAYFRMLNMTETRKTIPPRPELTINEMAEMRKNLLSYSAKKRGQLQK